MLSRKIENRDNYGIIAQNSSLAYNNYEYDLISSIAELLRWGKANEALDLLSDLQKSVAGHHPLFPHYYTDVESREGKLVFVSKPSSQEAKEKYPPKYKGKMTIPEKYKSFSSIHELLDYSYRHQEDIEINVKEIRKVLGDLDDPYQEKIFSPENLRNIRFEIKHREFPPARPYKMMFVNSDYCIDYISLRIKKITDDDEFIFSNEEQDTKLYIEIKLDTRKRRCDFNIRIKKDYKKDISANLAFISFMINAKNENEIKVISLEDGEELLSGYLDKVSFESNFGDEEKEKAFLENLMIIEDYYVKKIVLPDEILEEDIERAELLAKGIKNKEVWDKLSGFKMEFKLSEVLKQYIIESKDKDAPISYEMNGAKIVIFGETFEIGKVVRHFKNTKIDDIDKLIKKVEVLEEGDKISIKFIPADGKEIECVDEFYF